VLPAVESSTVKPSVKKSAAALSATVLVVSIFNLDAGLVVPIPTFPELSTRNLVALLVSS